MDASLAPTPKTRPLIGVTPRWFPAKDIFCAGESVGDVFMDALIAAGGMPIMVPITADKGLIRAYVDMCDGFAIPGGHNVNSAYWGEPPISPAEISHERDALEYPLIEMALEADKPFLGICRGAQLLNVVLGGSLTQDLTTVQPQGCPRLWKHSIILDSVAHPVEVEEGSLLHRIVGRTGSIGVNSSHNQCIARLGEGVRVVGRATDGIIEAIEVPDRRFCLGVQWHPEYTWQMLPYDFSLFTALVESAR